MTKSLFPGFDGLMSLSRREGVDVRPTLLRVLTDLYVQTRIHSEDEQRQFTELATRLIDQVDDATRAAIKAKLAIYPQTPVPVLQKLGLVAAQEGRRVPLAREIPTPAPAQRIPLWPPSRHPRLACDGALRARPRAGGALSSPATGWQNTPTGSTESGPAGGTRECLNVCRDPVR